MIPIPLPSIPPSRKLRIVELTMADAAQIPIEVMERAVGLLGREQPPSLLAVEREIGQRCACKSVDDNEGCIPHRVLAMLTDADDITYELAREEVVGSEEYFDEEQAAARVDEAKAALEKTHEEALEKKDEDLTELRRALKEHEKALEQACGLLTAEQHEKLSEIEPVKLNLDDEIKEKVQERTKELADATSKAQLAQRAAEFALAEATRKKRKVKTPPPAPDPAPLTREQVDAEVTAILGEVTWTDGGCALSLGTGQRLWYRNGYKSTWILEYGKHDVQLFTVDVLRVALLRAKVIELTRVPVSAPDAPTPTIQWPPVTEPKPVEIPAKVTVTGADVYETARHLALQPSGLQAMLEVARAQRPAEFKKRGK